MAHPYGTLSQLKTFLGTNLAVGLTTLDSATTSTSVHDAAREDSDNEIDAALAQKYTVPFAATTDVPATPGIIATISHNLTAANVIEKRHAEGNEHRAYRRKAEMLLSRILSGEYEIPGAAKVAASEGKVGFVTSATTPVFAGLDDDGEDRMKNF